MSRASSPAAIDIAANVAQYLGDRSPVERASSFDYCFNHFRDSAATGTLADPEHREASCLHLGYYLASWGDAARLDLLAHQELQVLRDGHRDDC